MLFRKATENNNSTPYFYGLKASGGFWIMVLFNLLASSLFAEGSKELNASGGNRAYLFSSAFVSVNNPFPTLGRMKVYVNAGEALYLGSSAQGIGGGTIIVRKPDGSVLTTSGSSTSVGLIENRTQEKNGPRTIAGDLSSYQPFIIDNIAQSGVYTVDFISPDVTKGDPLNGANNPEIVLADDEWTQPAGKAYIAAFDISVRNTANTAFIPGRTYTNIFGGNLGGFRSTFNAKFKILTKDGYVYDVNNNGQSGFFFSFFVNNKGFRNAAGDASYQSTSDPLPNVHDPRTADSGSDITHKIFFNDPADDLPAHDPISGNWLKVNPSSPSASDFLFTGTEGTLYQGGTFPLGGLITFKANMAVAYEINLDINKNGSFNDLVDVELTGTSVVGTNMRAWNGLDGQGNPVAGNLSFSPANMSIILRGGEVHFPFTDVENNVNGIVLTRLNGVGAPNDIIYWDDTNISGGTKSAASGNSSTTNSHKWGSTGYSSTAFGNEKGLDTWTYVESSPVSPLMNIQLRQADLEVVSIAANKTTFCAGEEITYTVRLKNNGPDAVTGAKFALTYPAGFEFISVSAASTTGVSNNYNNSSNATAFSSTVDMANQAVLTLTIKGKTNTVGNLNTIIASILRPADVTDPDATNPNSAVPTDPDEECNSLPSGPGCNNIKTASSVTITTRAISIQDAAVAEGTGATRNISFPVTIPSITNCDITVEYTVSHTTTDNADFEPSWIASGVVKILAGSLSANITLPVATDKIIEANETFKVTLSNPVGGTLNIGSAIGTINNDDTGAITITKTDGAEAGTVGGSFIFSFPSGVVSSVPTEIDYALAGTAVAGSDFSHAASATGTIVIPAGANSVTLPLPVTNDNIIEGAETVTIALTRLYNAHSGTVSNNSPVTPVVTIADDDTGTLTLSDDVVITEGSSGTSDATFTLTLSKATGNLFTLNYATSDGTAKSSDNDYIASGSVQLQFNGTAGEVKNITIPVKGDTKIESTELFNLLLSNLSDSFGGRLTIPIPARTITITNDDSGLITIEKTDGEEGVQGASFVFKYPAGLSTDIPVDISYVLSGSASAAGVDFTGSASGIITIPAGQNSVTLNLPVADDVLVEGKETVQLGATVGSNPYGIAIANAPQTLSILDNDAGILNISPVSITEGHSGTSTASFTVSLSRSTGKSFTLKYATADGSATSADADYTSKTGTLSFDGNVGTKTIEVAVSGDRKVEADEIFNIVLSDLSDSFDGRLTFQNTSAAGTIVNDDSGEITITKADGSESGPAGAKFVFSFPAGFSSDQPTIITYTIGGTASGSGIDYTASSVNTITIPAGQSSATLTFDVLDDSIVEDNETITLGGVTATSIYPGVSLNTSFPVISIADNDNAALVLSGPVTITEGNNGTTLANFTVTLDKATKSGFSLGYSTADGTALLADNDYISNTGALSFSGLAGESHTITVAINGDTKLEPSETFILNLAAPSDSFSGRLTLPVNSATATISNDDAASITISKTDGSEGSYDAAFTFSFPAGVTADLPTTIDYTLSGTAKGTGVDKDYTASVIGTVTIAAGQNSVTLPVPVVDDLIAEDTETVVVTTGNVSSPYGFTVSNSGLSLNVFDNDQAVLNLSGPVSVMEGNTGTVTATFNVTLSRATGSSFTVNYNTADGTAMVANSDYVAGSGVLNFNGTAGEVKTISVTVNGDLNMEADETFGLVLSGLSSNFNNRLSLAKNSVIGNILNDDGGDIAITSTPGSEDGTVPGTFTFSFPSGVTSDQPTVINYTLSGGTAIAGTDYTGLTSGSVTIAAGANSVVLSLPVVDDAIVEDDETIYLTTGTVSSTYGYTLSNTTQALTILDNDQATITLSGPVTLAEGDAGTVNATFNISLSKATTSPFTLGYSSADGTALVADNDYIPVNNVLSFDGTSPQTQTVTVAVNGDKKIEANEAFLFKLFNLSDSFNNRLAFAVAEVSTTITNDDAGNISITKFNGAEGVQGGSYVLSFPAGVTADVPVTVNYNLTGTSQGGGIDYSGAISGTITINAEESTAVLNLPVIDDALIEDTETITFTAGAVSSPYGTTISTLPQEITIADNDNGTLSISPIAVLEGSTGTSTATFQVTLNKAAGKDFTVNFTTLNGTATDSDNDFTAQSGTLTFNANTVGPQLINVLVNGDRKIEADEHFSVKLSGLSNHFNNRLSIGTSSGTGTITNDDSGIISVTPSDGSESGPNPGTFTFSLQPGYTSDQPVSINYTLAGTASGNGIDYTGANSASVTIPAGQNNVVLSIPVNDDQIIEEPETVVLHVGTVSGTYPMPVSNSPQTLTISDNDNAVISLSGPVTVVEGNAGTTAAGFSVTLNKATSSPFTLNYTATDGTALLADNDYVSANGVLSFTGVAGETKTITVNVNGDKKIEANELFNLSLNNLSRNFGGNLAIPVASTTGSINNDDSGAIIITKSDAQEGVQGGSFTFSFGPGLATDIPVNINYTLAGTATGGSVDYIGASPGTIMIPAGANSVALNLPVIDDTIIEDTETVELTASVVSNAYGIDISNPAEAITIMDNDAAVLSIGQASVVEGHAGTQTLTFPVTLNKATRSGFTLGYSTADGTATVSDGDYVAAAPSSVLSFLGTAGEVQTASIQVNGDKKIEADEVFTLTIGDLSTSFNNRLTIPVASVTGTIKNDDSGVITVTKADGSETGPSAGTFIFNLQSGVVSDAPATINYTLSGTAGGNGQDYTGATSGTIVLPAGESRVVLTLPVIDDAIIENVETVTVAVTSIQSVYSGAFTVDPVFPVLSITDNDFATLTLSEPVQLAEGNSGTTAFNFTVTLDKATGNPFTVNYATADGTATIADNDYIASGTVPLSFAGTAGESKTITVLARGDLKLEANEDFNLLLSSLSNNFGDRLKIQGSPVKGTIGNDDGAIITITKNDGTEGGDNASFTFSFPQGVSSDAATIINYRLAGTATSADYTSLAVNSITIPAGANSAVLILPVIDDTVIEEPESVSIDIVSVSNTYTNLEWSLPLPVLTIFDNDNAVLSISSPTAVKEKNSGTAAITFKVTLDVLTSRGFEVDYTTVNGTASVADKDYEFKSGRLSFAGFAGESKEITVLVNGDIKVEDDESFQLMLDAINPSFAGRLIVQGNPGAATILNDDVAPVAKPDVITTAEDTPVTFSIVTNDSDADGIDPKTIALTSLPVKGELKANADGTVTYIPVPDDYGSYRFTYTVLDVLGLVSNEAAVTINVTPVNDAPVADNDMFYVHKNTSVRATVADNDRDPDADVLRFKLLTSPSKGQLQFFNPTDGSFIYTPQADFEGVDGFTYEVNDPAGLKDNANVTLNVQPSVTVNLTPDKGTITEGDTISITAELTEPLLQDVVVTLSYDGTAQNDKDYSLSQNFETITIPAGTRVGSQKLVIQSIKDYIKEGDEEISVKIAVVSPTAFVSIGNHSTVNIKDFYPEDKPAEEGANPDINPDPLASPNGDGIGNERFIIRNIERYPDNEVMIFNRWGNEVYSIRGYNNSDKAFAGIANKGLLANGNAELVDGVYYFIIHTTAGDGTKKVNKGFVIIKR